MRRDSEEAWRKFRERVTELGGQVVEQSWLGTKVPHRVLCAAGHEAQPRPGDVNRGIGLCVTCAGKDQNVAWLSFLQLVAERGGEVLEPRPLGVNTPHRVRCSAGHETKATPSYVRVGGGMCPICAPTSTVRAEQRFRSLVEKSGGRVLELQWLGSKRPHRVVCAQGHETSPRPFDIQQSGHMCRVCSGHDSVTSWRAFQERVTGLGGTVTEPKWLGNKVPHSVVCAMGHSSRIRPNNVQQGGGICRTCAYKVWDVFYVVANDVAQAAKFGITSYDPRARLRYHRADGFERVLKTITGMPEAPELERKILTSLRSSGIKAIAGREYFDLSALPMILRIVDEW